MCLLFYGKNHTDFFGQPNRSEPAGLRRLRERVTEAKKGPRSGGERTAKVASTWGEEEGHRKSVGVLPEGERASPDFLNVATRRCFSYFRGSYYISTRRC